MRFLFFAMLLLLVPAALHAQAESPVLPADTATLSPETAFIPGEILVGIWRDRASIAEILAAHQLPHVQAQTLDTENLCWLENMANGANITMQRLQVPVGQELTLLAALERHPAVAFASLNQTVRAAGMPSTPGAMLGATIPDASESNAIPAQAETPFLVNDPLYEQEQWYLQRINASRAWSIASTQTESADRQIAIVDSGINLEHPDLAGRILPGYNYIDPTQPPADDFGHGSHVAGLMGAILNNQTGITGAAIQIQIDPRKVLNQFGEGSVFNVAVAICDATDDGADIINLSLETQSNNPYLKGAVQYAHDAGALLIAAAGNFNQPMVQWPAQYEEVMAVAATGYYNERASYSNRGDDLEIAAPGGNGESNLLSTWRPQLESDFGADPCASYSNVAEVETYCYSKGTSMSAALVSGSAALVWGMRPDLTAEEVRAMLRDTAAPLEASATHVGRGLLDAEAAARRALRSNLTVTASNTAQLLTPGTAPYTVTIAIENPSSEALDWQATLPNEEWLTTQNALSGTISYGAPVHLSLMISPTNLSPGQYGGAVTILGTRSDASQIAHVININFVIANEFHHLFLPFAISEQAPGGIAQASHWETNDQTGRTTFVLGDNDSILVPISPTFPLKGRLYSLVRLDANGFIDFPDADDDEIDANLPNSCLPTMDGPQQAVYGWWADLNPSAPSARLSMFQPDPGRLVFEFMDVPAVGVTPAYSVSFQIVLYSNGTIGLNYLNTPSAQGTPPLATVGVYALDRRFRNQIACVDGQRQLNVLPHSGQTFLLQPADIF